MLDLSTTYCNPYTKKEFIMKKSDGFDDEDFKKSSWSGNWGGAKLCVEVAQKNGLVAVRDSKDPKKNTLVFTSDEWVAFVRGVKSGEFD